MISPRAVGYSTPRRRRQASQTPDIGDILDAVLDNDGCECPADPATTSMTPAQRPQITARKRRVASSSSASRIVWPVVCM
jgi:hypothetical protein